jgi:hypothetical protein
MSFPLFILVMRHAEKPQDASDPNLSPAGEARAASLATYVPATFGTPDFIFAAAISADSARPVETVTPLSNQVGVPIDDKIADKDYAKLANDLLTKDKYAGRRVVVCWHHGHIPGLLAALGAPSGSYPSPWNPEVFNLIVRLDGTADGPPAVSQIAEPF